MDFLKAHYEKVILGLLVAALIAVLAWLSSSIEKTSKVSSKDLQKYNASVKMHDTADFSKPEFSPDQAFSGNSTWKSRSGVKTETLIFQAELAAPFKGARCSNPDCKKIIPLETMKQLLKCPYCGTELKPPPEVAEDAIDMNGADSDGDGMPDAYEIKMGFNAFDPTDALKDADQDGFYNLYEMLMNTDPVNGKSRPGMDKRICLFQLEREQIPYRLEKVTTDGTDDKANWTVHVYDLKKRRNRLWDFGQEVEISKKQYKLADIRIVAASDLEAVDQEKASIVLEPIDPPEGEKLTMNAKEDAYLPNAKAKIVDVPTKKVFTLAVGETFTIGDDSTGKVPFQLLNVDPVKETATLLNQENGEETLLKLQSTIGSVMTRSANQNLNFNRPRSQRNRGSAQPRQNNGKRR